MYSAAQVGARYSRQYSFPKTHPVKHQSSLLSQTFKILSRPLQDARYRVISQIPNSRPIVLSMNRLVMPSTVVAKERSEKKRWKRETMKRKTKRLIIHSASLIKPRVQHHSRSTCPLLRCGVIRRRAVSAFYTMLRISVYKRPTSTSAP